VNRKGRIFCKKCGVMLGTKNSVVQSFGEIVWRRCKVCGTVNNLEVF